MKIFIIILHLCIIFNFVKPDPRRKGTKVSYPRSYYPSTAEEDEYHLSCITNEDCREVFQKPVYCADNFCVSHPSYLPCQDDGDCDLGNICEERSCRQVSCLVDDNCPVGGEIKCDDHQQLCRGNKIKQKSINGGWSNWGPWQKDGQNSLRLRTCTNPKPTNEGLKCKGKSYEIKQIPKPINGGWSNWGPWEKDGDSVTRLRRCTNPKPTNGGLKCRGKSYEIQQIPKPEPVLSINGGWSNWGPWEKDGDSSTRLRTCTNPKPTNDGLKCKGKSYETKQIGGCVEVNVNYGGNDISEKLSTHSTWQQCQNHCGTNTECTHWTFRTSDGNCWLKSANDVKTIENDLVSGPRECPGTITPKPTQHQTCNAGLNNPKSRRDCGYKGITAAKCQARGCCFKRNILNFKSLNIFTHFWKECFHKSNIQQPQPTKQPKPTKRPTNYLFG